MTTPNPAEVDRYRHKFERLGSLPVTRRIRMYPFVAMDDFVAIYHVAVVDRLTLIVRTRVGSYGAFKQGRWLGFCRTLDAAKSKLAAP